MLYFINYSIIFLIIVSQFFSNDMLLMFLTDNQEYQPDIYSMDIICLVTLGQYININLHI